MLTRRSNPVWAPWVAGVGVVAAGVLTYELVARLSSGGLPAGIVPPRPSEAPFAKVKGSLSWPVRSKSSRVGEVGYVDVNGVTHGNASRRFGAVRPDGRQHAGVDLYGFAGDTVVAIADGVVVAIQGFNLGTDAMLVEHRGAVALYGEIDPHSWNEFGIGVGSRVKSGQPIARIGCMVGSMQNCDSEMLHFETYVPGTTENHSWQTSPPAALLDPTHLLLSASTLEANT